MIPIGVIVAVAIVCVIVAVLSSARRADEVALDHERQLFIRSLTNYSERVLRETASVATSEAAARRIRVAFDAEWVELYVGLRLQSFFDHDFVFVTDASDRFIYASLGLHSADPNWFNAIRVDVQPVLDELRGRAPRTSAAGTQIELVERARHASSPSHPVIAWAPRGGRSGRCCVVQRQALTPAQMRRSC